MEFQILHHEVISLTYTSDIGKEILDTLVFEIALVTEAM